MWLKYCIITLLSFLFVVLQFSFLPYFNVGGAVPNLVFILFFTISFFGRGEEGFFTALLAGFLLDIFLSSYFGVSILALVILYFVQKLIAYFFKKDTTQYLLGYFMIVFMISFILYTLIMYVSSLIFPIQLNGGGVLIISLIYNGLGALVGFYIYKIIAGQNYSENQLKLL